MILRIADVSISTQPPTEPRTSFEARFSWSYVITLALSVALEAQDEWRSSPLWSKFYHETGIYWISRTGFAQKVLDNFKELGRDAELYALPVQEARKLYGNIFDKADYEGVDNVLINNTSGWAAAKDALLAGITKAIEIGVKYVAAEIDVLEFDDHGCCVGVRSDNGRTIKADRTIICTGDFTPVLLDKAAKKASRNALTSQQRMIAAGVTTGLVTLDKETTEILKDMPVCIQENPTHRGKHVFLNSHVAFTNKR